MSDRVDKEVSGSAGPQPTLFEKAQLGVYAFVGGLTMDARLYSLLPIIEQQTEILTEEPDSVEGRLMEAFLVEALKDIPPITEEA